MIVICRHSFIRMGFWGILFSAAGIWFLLAPVIPESWTIPIRILGVLGLILGISGCLVPFFSRLEISDEEIVQTGFRRRQALRWWDITRAYLSGDPDTPSTRSTLYLESGTGQIIVIVFSGLRRPYEFLQEVLRHLPATCEIDPDLIGFAKEGRKYSWKLFVRTDLRAILIGLPIILILLWIFLSGIWSRW